MRLTFAAEIHEGEGLALAFPLVNATFLSATFSKLNYYGRPLRGECRTCRSLT
jgi:hypothetical protein